MKRILTAILLLPLLAAFLHADDEPVAKKDAPDKKENAKPEAKPTGDKNAPDKKPKKDGDKDDGAEKPAKADDADEKKAEEKKKPETHKAVRKPLRVKLTLDAILESASMDEISIRTTKWGDLTVLDALPQGASVTKGQSLVTLDFEKIDDRIDDLRHEITLLQLDRSIAETELRLAEQLAPLDKAQLDRLARHSKEDYERHRKVLAPYNREAAEISLKSYKQSLAYAQEELNQLKKMYEADDLTEETEEIILIRAQNAVDRATFSLKGAEIRHENATKFLLPRENLAVEDVTKRDELAHLALKKIQPAQLRKLKLQDQKLEEQLKNANKTLSLLEKDRRLMAVPSPADGILYRGAFHRGKWSGDAALRPRLRRGGALKPNEVVMTIVRPRPLFLRASVSEKDLRRLKPGMKAKTSLTAFPDLKPQATAKEISAAPVSPGKFDLRADLPLPKDSPLLPGMTAKLTFTVYENEKALVVPASAVFSEEEDEDAKYILLYREDGKPKKQTVTTGERSGDDLEILTGLRPNREILAKKPEEGKE